VWKHASTISALVNAVLADDSDAVRRKYKKDLDHLKSDLEVYNRQKEIALGLAAGTLAKTGEGSSSVVPTSQEQRLAAESLYRNANTLIYGDNKPSEDAIDKVVSKINQEYVLSHFPRPPELTVRSVDKKRKFSRKRANEDEGDITYINERNRVFNKKVDHSSAHHLWRLISLFLT
jgi:pre-mRNA-splicing factor SYF2